MDKLLLNKDAVIDISLVSFFCSGIQGTRKEKVKCFLLDFLVLEYRILLYYLNILKFKAR